MKAAARLTAGPPPLRLRRRSAQRQTPFFGRHRHKVGGGVRVYAVGDIHGRLDLLTRMLDQIDEDRRYHGVDDARLVFLGDYIDRGPHSADVLELLSGGNFEGFTTTCLLGNHEGAFVDYLEGRGDGIDWLTYGGIATAASYGVVVPPSTDIIDMAEAVRPLLRKAVPPEHRHFLKCLPLSHAIDDYLFVHAGLLPGLPLDRQDPLDLLTIREPFLASEVDHGRMVVHGHTMVDEPEIQKNRIAIDTGAFATGRLTCLVLDGGERRFLVADAGRKVVVSDNGMDQGRDSLRYGFS